MSGIFTGGGSSKSTLMSGIFTGGGSSKSTLMSGIFTGGGSSKSLNLFSCWSFDILELFCRIVN